MFDVSDSIKTILYNVVWLVNWFSSFPLKSICFLCIFSIKEKLVLKCSTHWWWLSFWQLSLGDLDCGILEHDSQFCIGVARQRERLAIYLDVGEFDLIDGFKPQHFQNSIRSFRVAYLLSLFYQLSQIFGNKLTLKVSLSSLISLQV